MTREGRQAHWFRSLVPDCLQHHWLHLVTAQAKRRLPSYWMRPQTQAASCQDLQSLSSPWCQRSQRAAADCHLPRSQRFHLDQLVKEQQLTLVSYQPSLWHQKLRPKSVPPESLARCSMKLLVRLQAERQGLAKVQRSRWVKGQVRR